MWLVMGRDRKGKTDEKIDKIISKPRKITYQIFVERGGGKRGEGKRREFVRAYMGALTKNVHAS